MKYLLLSIAVCFLLCCTNSVEKEGLLGAWEIVSAQRNGKPTETLNGAYFEFDENDLLTTNLLGREESSPFEFNVERSQIIQRGSSNLNFGIAKFSDDELQLETTIRDIPFTIVLRRIR